MDRELLFRFLNDTQPDEMDALRKIYKTDLEDTIVGFINAEVTKARVDLVIFLNGLAIMSFELKCNAAGQSYQDAIYQYRVDRDPKTRLFWFKAGCLVNFAMDLEQVYMTTKLAGNATFFLPFNMGNGEGVNAGAGNPTFKDKYSAVSYTHLTLPTTPYV